MAAPKIGSRWISVLEEVVKDVRIASKEVNATDDRGVPLVLWDSQKRVLKEIATGLDLGIHIFFISKSRQLGITTITLLIDVVWLAFHKHMTCALVTDTEKNRDANRRIIRQFIQSFDDGYFGDDFSIISDNRQSMVFSNGSRIDFLVAGTKNKGTYWGEGVGYAMVHLTEVASYGSPDGLASFEESFSQTNEHRLFIYESTSKGHNHWKRKWDSARADIYSNRTVFVGWWSGDTNIIARSDPRFLQYGTYAASGEEREKVQAVAAQYGHKITPEQLAWIRWRDANADDDQMQHQNQPWLPEESFVVSGYSFFQVRQLGKMLSTMDANENGEYSFVGYKYDLGSSFFDIKLVQLANTPEQVRQLSKFGNVELCEDMSWVELRVWEEPVEEGKYVIGFDPAWGRNDHKDRFAISVWRCYADKMVQVAEFATADIEPKHGAWIFAHLAGAYKDCLCNVEINGPGRMIMQELQHVRELLNADMFREEVRSLNWEEALSNARWFLYHRADSTGGGYAYNFECLALDTPLPTPMGWTTMGQVKEGDYLLSEDGKPTQVIGLSDFKTGTRCFEVSFDDGTEIIADENHWWKVGSSNWRDGEKMRQTHQLRRGYHYVKKAQALDLPSATFHIDPYLLGLWLGDGSSDGAIIWCGDEDVEETVANIEACGQATQRTRLKTAWQVRLNWGGRPLKDDITFLRQLRFLNLLNNKHIPPAYLRGSLDQRFALLQGLMDSDGTAGGNGGRQCAFSTTNRALVEGFSELVRSLGIKAKYTKVDENKYKPGVNCALKYQFWFTPPEGMIVFRLKRKQDKIESSFKSHKEHHHRIEGVYEVPSVTVRCLKVDHPSEMFLAGEGMIPTHNTTWKTKSEIMFQLRGALVTNELHIRSRKLVEEMANVYQDDGEIGAPDSAGENSKDDRVFAAALANRAWLTWIRPGMLANGETYDVVTRRENGERPRQMDRVLNQVYNFFRRREDLEANVELMETMQMNPTQRFLRDRGL